MRNELIINGLDAWEKWHVEMGDSFIPNITAPAPMKDVIENKSRLSHGKQVIVTARKDERDITLTFIIGGSTQQEYRENYRGLKDELEKQQVDIQIPSEGSEVYHLLYTGKSISYGLGAGSLTGKLAVKFNEPNPGNRE